MPRSYFRARARGVRPLTLSYATGCRPPEAGGPYHVSTLDIRTDAVVLFEAPANVLVKNTIYANIYAPNSAVWLNTSTKGTGAFIGKRVRIGEKAELKLGIRGEDRTEILSGVPEGTELATKLVLPTAPEVEAKKSANGKRP